MTSRAAILLRARTRRLAAASAVLTLAAALSACVTRPPSIAHVHIGHAITGVHVTPAHQGYVELARQRAQETIAAATLADRATDLAALKEHIAAAVRATDDGDNFGVKQSVTMAANHIAFAATSADASANVVRFAPDFKNDIAAVIGRCDYIELLGGDVAASTSLPEAAALVREILTAARANLEGDDGSGGKDASPSSYGITQLSAQIQDMLARESPPYRTVDEWYLFNLVRLPNGRWVFDKLARGGNIDGYK